MTFELKMRNLIVAVLVLFSTIAINGAFKIKPKIVNGYRAQLGQFPYFAFLEVEQVGTDKIMRCGGSLLDDRWILTAAHCIMDAERAIVHLGESELDLLEISHVTILVEKNNLHIHPDFFEKPYSSDIALIELPQSVQFSLYVQPVPLPDNCETPEIVDAVTAGHGAISDLADYSRRLHFAYLKTLPDNVCHREFPFLNAGDSVICAANKQLNQSVCGGDSGGPLVTKSNVTLIGVTNFVKRGGCEKGEPQGFQNVRSHFKWMKKITQLNLPSC